MTEPSAQPAVVFEVPEALQALEDLVAQTPTVAIVGTLTAFKRGRRWANGEIAAHKPNGNVRSQLRLSFPPQAAPGKTQLEVGNQVRVVGRFVVDHRYGPVQFQVNQTTVLQNRAESASAVDQLVVSIRNEGLDAIQKRLPLPTEASNLLIVCPLNRGAGGTDFIERLERSGHDWDLDIVEVPMGGSDAGSKMASALTSRTADDAVDVIVLCRGGGSPAELAPFDSEELARAIVESSKPVVVAVGHHTDRHVADLVAFRSCATPTAAAEWFVTRRDAQRRQAQEAATRIRALEAQRASQRAELLADRARRTTRLAIVVIVVALIAVLVFMAQGLT